MELRLAFAGRSVRMNEEKGQESFYILTEFGIGLADFSAVVIAIGFRTGQLD